MTPARPDPAPDSDRLAASASGASSLWPDQAYGLELLRPWKLTVLALGLGWLIYGALNYGIGDWDVGDSLIMGGLTYLCAPWSVRTLLLCLQRRPRGWLVWMAAAIFVGWAVADGSYTLYNLLAHHPFDRAANFPASATLYLLAGFAWLYRGSLRDMLRDVRRMSAR